jgi:ADP-heptose:LPS heptosyltransferase
VFVLSRVTLGADVAVTSVLLDAAKRRFPRATIWFAGSRKNYELFADDSRIVHLAWPYPRAGSIAERLAHMPQLPSQDAIVIDPDSRLTQLGMLPVCDDDRYFFFESRGYGSDSDQPLPDLAAKWAAEVLGVARSRAYVAPARAQMPFDVAVSFGVGENDEKRLEDPFEEELLRAVCAEGLTVVLDKGAGGEEAARAERLASRIPSIRLYEGPYATFASMISQARLYIGYDSAGQHVAAASATPLISVFAGFPSDRMFERWRPQGRGPTHVVKVEDRSKDRVLAEALQYLTL